ncbi:hypothetical protein HDIA_4781 [Hartmannibacter diazotrophicus]|uniref:DUF2937 family protein n=1 Tax=Hartmannibacter diazotrophicus TaxID=1482074 RepID=A0A2C9DDA9_9HYPH|nr:DUF2937 family protein [Hartmannibacter diazotrophicus]SON58322.1 hypothetical protein HDIA_4781 [Hartmannibacter diazotrophicus]
MIVRLLRIVMGTLLALGFAQSPEFSQQYLQRLGGALDALRPIVEKFDAAANRAGLTREAALDRLERNDDPLVGDVGEATGDAVVRYERLDRQYETMRNAGAFGRIAAVLSAPDPRMLSAAWDDFAPAIPTTVEGILLTLAGFGLGWFGVGGAARARARLRRSKAPAAS